jgi:hypothetical protein
MPNYARIARAFRRYPMCLGVLADASRLQPAVCAVGALIVDTGAATPAELDGVDTSVAIDQYWPELRKTYGFTDEDDLHQFVDVNDVNEDFDDSPPVTNEDLKYKALLQERRQLTDVEYYDRLRRYGDGADPKEVEAWYQHELDELDLEESEWVRARLLAFTGKLAGTRLSRQIPACAFPDPDPDPDPE